MSAIGMSWDKRQRQPQDTFQNELKAKLKQRHSMGMTIDVTTSDEDDNSDDEVDEQPDDFMSQFFPKAYNSQTVKDRASPLGETHRQGSGHSMFMKKNQLDDSLEEETNKNTSHMKNNNNNKSLPESKNKFMKSSKNEKERPLSKEEIIFGRKDESAAETEQNAKKTWTPPMFKKTGLHDNEDQTTRSISPASSKGRRTPSMEPSLGTINETPTPQARKQNRHGSVDMVDAVTPRSRHSSRGSVGQVLPQDIAGPSLDDENLKESSRKIQGRDRNDASKKAPLSDIFGRAKYPSLDDVDDSEKNLFNHDKKPSPSPRTMRDDVAQSKKSPPKNNRAGSPGSRTTPTPNRRMSSSVRDSRSPGVDSQTPVSRGSSGLRRASPNTVAENTALRKTPSVLDFLTQDISGPKVKPRTRTQTNFASEDSIGREMGVPGDAMGDAVRERVTGSPLRSMDEDQSSLCEEVKEDPYRRNREKFEETLNGGSSKQTREHQAADAAISTVAGVQDALANTMRYIHPDSHDSKQIPKVRATKTPRHKPQPRYAHRPGEESVGEASFDDTVSIRSAVYNEWHKERTAQMKEEMRERKKMEAELEDKEKKSKVEKLAGSKSSYDAWLNEKTKLLKEKSREESRNTQEKIAKEAEASAEKKKDSEATFNNWKGKKDVIIKDKVSKEKRDELEKMREEGKLKKQKRNKNAELYESWKSNKDKVIHEKVKKEKEEASKTSEEERRENRKRDKEARKLYTEWLVKKEITDKRNRETLHNNHYHSMEYLPPWSPAG